MNDLSYVLKISRDIQTDMISLGASLATAPSISSSFNAYDSIVTNKALRRKTEKLFKDGHHARAVEEAYKLLDNFVKKKTGLQGSTISGSSLMQQVFSQKSPILMLNSGTTASEKDEQNGYMQILAGCMTGIRNPRAHESDWEDTEERALQLLAFANHLIQRVEKAEIASEKG